MKKTLFLAALMAAASWGTVHAQSVPDPICNITFKAEDGSNSRVQNTGTGGNAVSEYNIGVGYTGTDYNPMKKDGDLGRFIGYTDGSTMGYYWCKYDADDLLGTAFGSTVTWEILFRLDRLEGLTYETYAIDSKATANSDGTWPGTIADKTAGTTKFFSGQQGGGWCFRYYPNTGLSFDYVHSTASGDNTYITPKIFFETGKFYHLVTTLNLAAKEVYFYCNGTKYGPYALKKDYYCHPGIGTTERSKDMWFDLGGDPGNPYSSVVYKADKSGIETSKCTRQGTTVPGRCEQAARTSWVFARVYGDALSEAQAATLYNDDVKYYTEPTKPNQDDIIMDAVFGESNTYADYSAYNKKDKALGRVRSSSNGSNLNSYVTINTQWNDTQKRYEMVAPGDASETNYATSKFLLRRFMYDPSIESQLSDAFSFECYAKATGTAKHIMSPLSFQQGGGIGFEFVSNNGQVKFNCNAYGYSATKTTCLGTQLSTNFDPTAKSVTTTDYNHYVLTFDRAALKTKMYVNGVEVATNSPEYADAKQFLSLPFARYHWFAIGGDTKNNIGSQVDYPWYGTISIARVWSKALTDDDVALLAQQAVNPETTVTIGSTGFATVRLPYIAKMPTGLTAYAVTEQTGTTATLTPVAKEDECLPYGAPVILQGDPGTYTFEVFNTGSPVTIATNLLEGSLAGKDVKANEVYVLADNGSDKAVLRKTDALTIPANKAWLPATAGGASAKTFVTGGGLDAISAVKAAGQDAKTYYNLQGQPVSQPQRGIYIQGGKKVFVK